MVSLQSAENALKSFYLDAVKDSIDMKTSPFLAKVEQSTADIYGKDVKKVIRLGFHAGVVSGTETGDLPKADAAKYLQLTASLKNLYGTIEISDKAIRATQGNDGGLVNLLNSEMENLLKGAKYNFNRMLMGNGQARLGAYELQDDRTKMQLDNLPALQVGMVVNFCNYDGVPYEGATQRTVLSIDPVERVVKFSGDPIPEGFQTGLLYLDSVDEEMTGLDALFTNKSVYGLSEEDYAKIKPVDYLLDGAIDELTLQTVMDMVEEHSGSAPNMIICSFGVRRALINYFTSMGTRLQTMEIEGGYKSISFNGIPIVADRFCPCGTMYLVNTDDFKLCQLGDWQWMESEDGKILHQIPGKPVYTATLVKYAELLCTRPNAQARIHGIEE
ncbi:MAG: phage major capsid protein [Clostridia bacterium]|nr:phage major capsid protein [Clostridia bacterium]